MTLQSFTYIKRTTYPVVMRLDFYYENVDHLNFGHGDLHFQNTNVSSVVFTAVKEDVCC